MIARLLGSLVLIALLGLNLALPSTSIGRRGSETTLRADISPAIALGQPLPEFTLSGFDGRSYTRDDLLGKNVLMTFERSVDW